MYFVAKVKCKCLLILVFMLMIKKVQIHIPNHYRKNTDATVLNKWHAWGKLYLSIQQGKYSSGIEAGLLTY